MKAVILAAGKGTRLLPLTETIPKVMVPINGKPFLQYVLEQCQKAGLQEIAIVVGYNREKIIDFVAKQKIEVTIIEQQEQRGTGHALKMARAFCGDDDFIVQGGDNLFSIMDLWHIQKQDIFCYIAGKEMKEWQKYGVLVVDHGKLIQIVEKPAHFIGNLINTGLYKCTAEIWAALDQIILSSRGEYELTDAFNILSREGKVRVLALQDSWLDLGCKEDIPKIEQFLRENYYREQLKSFGLKS